MKLLIHSQISTSSQLEFANGFHFTIHNGCNQLSILGLKLLYVSKWGPWERCAELEIITLTLIHPLKMVEHQQFYVTAINAGHLKKANAHNFVISTSLTLIKRELKRFLWQQRGSYVHVKHFLLCWNCRNCYNLRRRSFRESTINKNHITHQNNSVNWTDAFLIHLVHWTHFWL